MPTDYDAIAHKYPEIEAISIRFYLELPSLLETLGDISGQTVLDLACGTGAYTRLFAEAGAEKVVGVDISDQMLGAARAAEEASPLGIEYVHSDVAHLPDLGPFDLVTAVYLMHYSTSEDHLARVARSVYANMAPGARFVTCVLHPDLDRDKLAYDSLGFTGRARKGVDGAPDTIELQMLAQPDFVLRALCWSREQYEKALRSAGLVDIEWREYAVSEGGIAKHGQAYWQYYLDNPHACIITARRPAK